MCGIAGAVIAPGVLSSSMLRDRVADMTSRLVHRGPDGSGVHATGRMAFGHRRLAVVDLSEAGAQPLVDEARGLVLTYNGEIYNHVALRHELEAAGHRFRGHCDTEVLLRGYAQWGPAVVHRLRGMFAFAIWDCRHETLFLARDRLGQKPLFHTRAAEGFLFASEAKALLAWPGLPRRADPAALDAYLTLGYTPGRLTGFQGIERLPAGHTLTLHPDGRTTIERYWAPPEPGLPPAGNRRDLMEEFRARLEEAVSLRAVADVKVGAFLSGGVDSSAICAFMAPHAQGRLATFSAGFGTAGYDETDAALTTARHLGTDHQSFLMDDGLLDSLARLVWHFDTPFADSSAVVTHALSGRIREHVTVALSGDGADELLLGYPRYGQLAAVLAAGGPEDTKHERSRLSPFPDRAPTFADAYVYAIEKFREHQKLAGYDHVLLPHLKHPFSRRFAGRLDTRHGGELAAARLDLDSYLPDDILVKMDLASMAHGLEVRSPFLDHCLVEWISRLPPSHRAFGGVPKALLKDTVAPLLPDGLTGRTKMGFRVPVSSWLAGPLHDFVRGLLDSDRFAARGLLRPAFVRELLDQHVTGTMDHSSRLWALLTLELWFQTFIDGDGAGPLSEPYAARSVVA